MISTSESIWNVAGLKTLFLHKSLFETPEWFISIRILEFIGLIDLNWKVQDEFWFITGGNMV